MFSNLTFDLNFKLKLRPFCLFYTKNVCKSLLVLAIKLIFIINDRCKTCFKKSILRCKACFKKSILKFDLDLHFKVKLRPKTSKKVNLLPQNHKCQNWTKSSYIISKKTFLKFVWGNFLWPIFFQIMLPRVQILKMTILMLNNLFTIGFRAKIVLTGYRKS
jgi:hypothetical protein